MTFEGPDERTTADYRESLISELQSKDVPGDLIDKTVAKVEGHVADTDEDPNRAFGSPSVYAARLTTGREPWWHIAITVLLAGSAGWFVFRGLLTLPATRASAHFGPPGWVSLAFGLLIIPALIVIHRRSIRVRSPLTGAETMPKSRWGLVTFIGVAVAIIAMIQKVTEIVDALSE